LQDLWDVSTNGHFKRSFVLVVGLNSNVIIALSNVKFGE
jgi:hypothetical protein